VAPVGRQEDRGERTALVTGGGRGIGRAIARALAADGRVVAVADLDEGNARQTASMISSGGARAYAVRIDVTDGDSVSAGVSGRGPSWDRLRSL